MEKELYAYLAGCIDCDGSIQVQRSLGPIRKFDGIRPEYYTPKVSFTQVDRIVIDLLHKTFNGIIYKYERPNIGKGYWHTWHVTGQRAVKVLEAIKPYLRTKPRQADAALRLAALIAEQNAQRKKGRESIIPAHHVQARLDLLHEVRRYNARSKASRYDELRPPIESSLAE